MNCRSYARYDHMINRNGYNAPKNTKDVNFLDGRNYNSFTPFLDHNIECYRCNNFGHKSHDSRSVLKSPLKENVASIHEEKWNKS